MNEMYWNWSMWNNGQKANGQKITKWNDFCVTENMVCLSPHRFVTSYPFASENVNSNDWGRNVLSKREIKWNRRQVMDKRHSMSLTEAPTEIFPYFLLFFFFLCFCTFLTSFMFHWNFIDIIIFFSVLHFILLFDVSFIMEIVWKWMVKYGKAKIWLQKKKQKIRNYFDLSTKI